MKTDTPETDVWEAYCDECYYHMWRLRRKTDRGWYDGFHIHTGEEAKGLCETLNKLERELNEARAESIRWMSIAEGRGRCTLRGGPDAWVIGAWGDSITVTTAEDVMRGVRDFLDDGCRTITIERQGAPDRTDGGCTPIVSEDQLATVTAQRDRLAEVLQQCREDSVELVTERDRINAIINTFSNQ